MYLISSSGTSEKQCTWSRRGQTYAAISSITQYLRGVLQGILRGVLQEISQVLRGVLQEMVQVLRGILQEILQEMVQVLRDVLQEMVQVLGGVLQGSQGRREEGQLSSTCPLKREYIQKKGGGGVRGITVLHWRLCH